MPSFPLAERGPMVWSSTITAATSSGLFEPEPGAQMEQAFANARKALDNHGLTQGEVGQMTVYVRDQAYRSLINEPWLELFPSAGDRPCRRTTSTELPSGQLVQLQFVAVRGARRHSLEIAGLSHRDPIPMGVKLDDIIFSSGITGQDRETGEFGATAEGQIQLALGNMSTLMQAAGASLDNVAHLWVFMRDRADQQILVDEWLRAFPTDGQRPSRKTIRYDLAGGQFFQLHLTGSLGPRRNLEIPQVGHHDPIPMGSVTGSLFMSSGVAGIDPGSGQLASGLQAQTVIAFENLRTLCQVAGGDLSHVGHLTLMLRHFDDAVPVIHELERVFPDIASRPSVHLTTLGLPADDMAVQLHAAGWLP